MNNNIDPNAMYGLNTHQNHNSIYTPHNFHQPLQPPPAATNEEAINNMGANSTMRQLRNISQIDNQNITMSGIMPANPLANTNYIENQNNNMLRNTNSSNIYNNQPSAEESIFTYQPQPEAIPGSDIGCAKSSGISKPADSQHNDSNYATVSDCTNPDSNNIPTPAIQGRNIPELVEADDETAAQNTTVNLSLSGAAAPFAQSMDISGEEAPQFPDYNNPVVVPSDSIQYMNGFLRTQKGKMAEVEFQVGNSTSIKRGYLTHVGANFIILKEFNNNRTIVCDYHNIKFVILYDNSKNEYIT